MKKDLHKKNSHKQDENSKETVEPTDDQSSETDTLTGEVDEGKEETLEEGSRDKQNAELLDRLQRTMADFDNYRKRTIKEKAASYDSGVKDTVEKLLPIVDNFERALQAPTDKDSDFYKGVEMIMRQFYGLFDDLGVEAIPALGEKFDHNLHFAVAHEENENHGENEIIYEMQKGYKFKDKVLRASMVKVAN